MKKTGRATLLAAMAAILGIAVPTWADPVRVVTGGFYGVSDGEGGEWNLSGFNFRFQGMGVGEVLPFWDCLLCASGDEVSLDGLLRLGDVEWGAAAAALDGIDHGRVYWDGLLQFDSGSILAELGGVASRPFTFTGHLAAFADPSRTNQLFATSLAGSGTATVRFFRFVRADPQGRFEVARIDYNFADPAPVPEPATMLLVGAGLAGAAARRRKRHPAP